jgi:hypothetical protein
MVGNSARYSLDGSALAMLGFGVRDIRIGPREFDLIRQSTAPTWLDWFDRYELLALLERQAMLVESDEPILALVALRQATDQFGGQGIAVPDATGPHEAVEQLSARVDEWIAGTAKRLAGRAIVL